MVARLRYTGAERGTRHPPTTALTVSHLVQFQTAVFHSALFADDAEAREVAGLPE